MDGIDWGSDSENEAVVTQTKKSSVSRSTVEANVALKEGADDAAQENSVSIQGSLVEDESNVSSKEGADDAAQEKSVSVRRGSTNVLNAKSNGPHDFSYEPMFCAQAQSDVDSRSNVVAKCIDSINSLLRVRTNYPNFDIGAGNLFRSYLTASSQNEIFRFELKKLGTKLLM